MKKRGIPIVLSVFYLAAILYFMFFAFRRPEVRGALGEYRYSFTPGIPLWLPKRPSPLLSRLWLFSVGNLLAFVPFGILTPMLVRTNYLKFILGFLLFIAAAELAQMLTYLGSFDVQDIIVNALGASIGYFSYKIGKKPASAAARLLLTAFLVLLLSSALIYFAERLP